MFEYTLFKLVYNYFYHYLTHYFANQGPSSQGYGFSSSHVWMWELDCEESWALKNWCFWTVCWRRLLRVPWTARRSNQSILKEISPGCSLEGLMTKLKPILWPPHVKSWLIGKDSDAGRDWGQEEKGITEDEMARWHHWLDGCESGWTPGAGDGQGGPACCDSWGCKESDTTEQLNCTDVGKDWRQEEKGSTEDEMARWHHWLDGHKFEQAPEVSDGQGSLACYSPCGSKDSGMTELLFSLTDVFRLSVTSFWVFFLFFLSTSSNNSDISFVVSVLLLFSTSVLGHCSKKMITTEFI